MISHLAPGMTSAGAEDGGGEAWVRLVGVGAKRPSLWDFRWERTVSDKVSKG